MASTLRHIEPRGRSGASEQGDSNPSKGPGEGYQLPKRRRIGVRIACEACRLKKSACDNQKPACGPCRKRRSSCHYRVPDKQHALQIQVASLEETLKDHTEFLDHLRSLPEDEALQMLRALKASKDLSNLSSEIMGELTKHHRPSNNMASRGMLPPTESALEFELSMRHQMAYRSLIPVDISLISLRPLLASGERLSSQDGNIFTVRDSSTDIESPPSSVETSTVHDTADKLRRSPSPVFASLTERFASAKGPFQTDRYCDERLHKLKISHWTKVPIDDDVAATAISTYVEGYGAFFGLFDADLFLSDLVDRRSRFCSGFLVSAILSITCQSYTASDIRAATLVCPFLDESQARYQDERSSDTLTTAVAIEILGHSSQLRGLGQQGLQLVKEGCEMATRMGLLGRVRTGPVEPRGSAWEMRARGHTAWGIYGFVSLHALYYHITCMPASPPSFDIPELGLSSAAVQERAPSVSSNRRLIAANKTFVAICKFWSIMHGITYIYRGGKSSPTVDQIPLSVVESKYRELLRWASELDIDLARGSRSPVHVSILHTLFHCTILEIFRPYLDPIEPQKLRSFTADDGSPNTIFAASLKQLKQILVEVRLFHPKNRYLGLLNMALIHVSGAMLKDRRDKDWRFYFMLCLCFWYDLYTSYPLHRSLIRGLLAMALRERVISTLETHILEERVQRMGRHHEKLEDVLAAFTVDFNLAMTKPDEADGTSLAQKFEELAVFSDFTTGLDEVTIANPESG